MSNRNKVILQLESPESALSMYNFLKQNPQNIGDHVLSCTLSPKMDSEVQKKNDPELGKESPDLKNSPVDESEVQTAADSSSVKPSEVEEETTSNIGAETSVHQEELVDEAELKDLEPDEKRRKIEDSSIGKSVTSDVSGDLDFLVPKAGFFCPICSLYYSGEKAMANHCKSTRHKQNTEKFMAK